MPGKTLLQSSSIASYSSVVANRVTVRSETPNAVSRNEAKTNMPRKTTLQTSRSSSSTVERNRGTVRSTEPSRDTVSAILFNTESNYGNSLQPNCGDVHSRSGSPNVNESCREMRRRRQRRRRRKELHEPNQQVCVLGEQPQHCREQFNLPDNSHKPRSQQPLSSLCREHAESVQFDVEQQHTRRVRNDEPMHFDKTNPDISRRGLDPGDVLMPALQLNSRFPLPTTVPSPRTGLAMSAQIHCSSTLFPVKPAVISVPCNPEERMLAPTTMSLFERTPLNSSALSRNGVHLPESSSSNVGHNNSLLRPGYSKQSPYSTEYITHGKIIPILKQYIVMNSEISIEVILDIESASFNDVKTKLFSVQFKVCGATLLYCMSIRHILATIARLGPEKLARMKVCIRGAGQSFVVAQKKYSEIKITVDPVKIAGMGWLGCTVLDIVFKHCQIARNSNLLDFREICSFDDLSNSSDISVGDQNITDLSFRASSSLLRHKDRQNQPISTVQQSLQDCPQFGFSHLQDKRVRWRNLKPQSSSASVDAVSNIVPLSVEAVVFRKNCLLKDALQYEGFVSPAENIFSFAAHISSEVEDNLNLILTDSRPSGSITLKLFKNINHELPEFYKKSMKDVLSQSDRVKNGFPFITDEGVFVLGFKSDPHAEQMALSSGIVDQLDKKCIQKLSETSHPVAGIKLGKCTKCHTIMDSNNVKTLCKSPFNSSINKEHAFTEFPCGVLSGPFGDFLDTLPGRSGRQPEVFALDCEMLYTDRGYEVGKVTIVNVTKGRIVLDIYIRPRGRVVDYNFLYSGLTPEMIRSGVDVLIARRIVLELVRREDILVGHGLSSDLQVLRIVHQRVLDTSILYLSEYGYRRKLKDLCLEHLKYTIQAGQAGHDSSDDAFAAADLTLLWYHKKFLSVSSSNLFPLSHGLPPSPA